MVSRIRVNRTNAASYVTDPAEPAGVGDEQPTDCSALTAAALDLCEWSNELKGARETRTQAGNASPVGSITGARGCVDLIAGSNPPVYRVSVAWQGMSVTTAPSLPCGATLYGNNDGYRRAFALTVSNPNLTLP